MSHTAEPFKATARFDGREYPCHVLLWIVGQIKLRFFGDDRPLRQDFPEVVLILNSVEHPLGWVRFAVLENDAEKGHADMGFYTAYEDYALLQAAAEYGYRYE